MMIKNSLSEKYEKNKKFQEEIDKLTVEYKNSYNYACYADFQKIKSPSVIKLYGLDNEKDFVVLYLGHLQSNDKDSAYKNFCYFIKIMEQSFFGDKKNNNKLFTVIFFNNLCKGDSNYNNLKNSLRRLPLKYFEHLKKILIVKPTFMIRNMDFLVSGDIQKFIKQKTVMINALKDLQNFGINLDNKFFNLLPSELKLDENPPPVKAPLKGNFKAVAENKPIVQNKISFLTQLNKYEISELGIPTVFKFMIMYLKNNPKFLTEEGIFRKSVSIDDENEVLSQLLQANYDYLDQVTNPHIVASLVKKFLTKLNPPLFDYMYYQIIMSSQIQTEQNISLIQCIVKKLDTINYNTLMFLCDFMVNQVISRQKYNKMTFYNIGVILTPCLLRSDKVSLFDLQFESKMRAFVELMLKNFEKIFGNKKAQNAIYHASMKIKDLQQYEQQNQSDIQIKQTNIIPNYKQQNNDILPSLAETLIKKNISNRSEQTPKFKKHVDFQLPIEELLEIQPQDSLITMPKNSQRDGIHQKQQEKQQWKIVKESKIKIPKQQKIPLINKAAQNDQLTNLPETRQKPKYNKNVLNHTVSFQLPIEELLDIHPQNLLITMPKASHRDALLQEQQVEIKQSINMIQSKIKITNTKQKAQDTQEFEVLTFDD